LGGKKRSPSARQSVIKFLKSIDENLIPVVDIDDQEHIVQNSINEDKVLESIIADRDGIDSVVFIDGDNYWHAVIVLKRLIAKGYVPSNRFRILLYYARSYTHSDPFKLDIMYRILSSTKYKDAVDTAITFDCGVLATLLPVNVSFHIITKDHFARELKDHMNERYVRIYSKWTSELMDLLFCTNIPQFEGDKDTVDDELMGKLDKIKEAVDVKGSLNIHSIMRLTDDRSIDANVWISFLSRKDIQQYLDVSLVNLIIIKKNT
jgi:hypothetical protein